MDLLKNFVKLMQTEMKEPTLYGGAHLFWIGVTILGIALIFMSCKNLSDKNFRRILLIFGSILIFLEVFKQLNFAYDSELGVWDYAWKQFPFQFCSVPMYVMFIVAFLKESKFRDCLCSFLATYGLFAGLVVLIYPNTVLSEVIFRFS